ncbi:MAG: ABC transporter ATP-binding protein [Erysipelotrichaceae bacterium]|nr:ABC transporter ATP-binding protein [Erysipelotrichaceae bacterium]
MAKIEKEQVITSYHGKLYSRLFAYMKPYLKNFIIALFLVLLVSGFALIQPMLIAQAMDTYIEGYDLPYAYVSKEEAEIEYNGLYLSKSIDFENSNYDSYAQMLYDGDKYYLYTDLTKEQSAELQAVSDDELNIVSQDDKSLTVLSEKGNQYTGKVLDKEELKLLRQTDYDGVKRIAILYAVVLLVNALCNIAQTLILQSAGQRIIYNIRNEIFEHIHSLPLRFFDTHPVGQIVTRVTNDVESLNMMYSNVIVNLVRNTVMIIGYAAVMFTLNFKLALVSMALLPFVVVITALFTKISRKTYRMIRTKVSALNTFLSEHISGMKLIQIFAREEEKYRQFSESTEDLFRSRMREIMVFAIFRPLINFTANLALAIVLYRGAHSVLEGALTVGTLYIFTSYIRSFFEPIQELTEQFSTLQNAFASAEKIFTLMDETNPIKELEEPVILPEVKGKIEFRHVWFAYDDEEYVLRDVSFVINPGEKVAFVGATGAGKSSILNLIGRYYEIQKGEILIDDVNIKELSTEQIRRAIGQVQQDVFIFTGDIKSNIRLLNENISDQKIVESSIAVNANHFIDRLPNKYDEAVTERGSTLSAGQRQLLSFARTLAIDPKILVMDEATANIDTETEQLIQKALKTMMEGRTTIMVAHRLSTIQHADNIIVMHKGKIRESGTHQQLLAQDGIYKKLYELQLYSNN